MLIVAHRGIPSAVPENTLESIEQAILHHADMVEIDVRITSDGVPVVFHDDNLTRLTGLNRRLEELPIQEVRTLRVKGIARIPSLEEVMDLCRTRIGLDIEIKESAAVPAVAKAIQRTNPPDNFIVTSFSGTVLSAVRDALPGMPRGRIFGTRTANPVTRAIEFFPPPILVWHEIQYCVCYHSLIHRLLTETSRFLGIKLMAWLSLEDDEECRDIFHGLIPRNLHGIITGRPDLLRAALGRE